MGQNISYLFTGHKLRLKSWAIYKTDFFISCFAAALHDGATLVFLTVIFSNIKELQGWGFNEMVFVWGFSIISRNLLFSFFDVFSAMDGHIRSGGLDRFCVRPKAMLLQIATDQGLNIFSVGRTIVGFAAIITVMPALHLEWWAFLYMPVAIVGGMLIMFGMNLAFVCLSFWFVSASPVYGAVLWTSQFGQYPTGIFALPLQVIFTWVLPYAMAGFFPAAFMMRGAEYQFYGLIEPVVGLVFFGIGMLVWRAGLRAYQSTGN